ncbi:hypothetical protein ABZP36_029711 [Zizania latifolia]
MEYVTSGADVHLSFLRGGQSPEAPPPSPTLVASLSSLTSSTYRAAERVSSPASGRRKRELPCSLAQRGVDGGWGALPRDGDERRGGGRMGPLVGAARNGDNTPLSLRRRLRRARRHGISAVFVYV